VGTPQNWEYYKRAAYPQTWETEDLTHERAARLIRHLRNPVVWEDELDSDDLAVRTIQPQSPGLIDRVWYGAGSLESARWGAEAGLKLLTSNVNRSVNGSRDFGQSQAAVIREYLEHHPDAATARVSQGLVVIPTDSATPAQVEKYRAYKAERDRRVAKPSGPKGSLYAEDLLGTSEQIAERLAQDPAYRLVDEVAFALPFTFSYEDFEQVLTDIVEHLAPALGWRAPALAPVAGVA
jgi:alkanesulfonate monooxygenase SsuD/methylene tetrahydromethanopterin reductase-like flavin-dependent oxidoreductase (luciferase family)